MVANPNPTSKTPTPSNSAHVVRNEVADRLAERGKRCKGGCEECTEWAAAKAEELKREKQASRQASKQADKHVGRPAG